VDVELGGSSIGETFVGFCKTKGLEGGMSDGSLVIG
jgi:hypothetical protein